VEPARNFHTPEAVTLFDFRSDPGPFQRLATSLIIQGTTWNGKVYASPQAIYLVPVELRDKHGGTVITSLIDQAVGTKGVAIIRTCLYADLPDGCRKAMDPQWSAELLKCNAIVLPKKRISKLQIGSLNNMLRIYSGGQLFDALTPMFGNGKVKRTLTALGYQLNVQIAEADGADGPATFAVVQPAEKHSMLVRVLLFLTAIIGFLLIVVVKVAMHDAFR
jgi:hypothetical protein